VKWIVFVAFPSVISGGVAGAVAMMITRLTYKGSRYEIAAFVTGGLYTGIVIAIGSLSLAVVGLNMQIAKWLCQVIGIWIGLFLVLEQLPTSPTRASEGRRPAGPGATKGATVVAQTAVAESFKQGGAAYGRGDYATAMQLWRPLADQGDPYAQTNLGRLYANGQGVPQDYAAAASWYRKAADQGIDTAQTNLGRMYDIGQGVPQDYASAASWYRKAADQGDVYAQYNLGILYAHGRGVTQNYTEAVNWYRKAADQGFASAQFNLADMYFNGRGVPQDNILAYMWLDLAAARGRENAGNNRDVYVARRMTPTQIAEAQRLAREWKPTCRPLPAFCGR